MENNLLRREGGDGLKELLFIMLIQHVYVRAYQLLNAVNEMRGKELRLRVRRLGLGGIYDF